MTPRVGGAGKRIRGERVLPLEQDVDGVGLDGLGLGGVNGGDGADRCPAAAEQGHGVAAGRAVVVAIDQAAEGVLQAGGGLAVDAELDWFG